MKVVLFCGGYGMRMRDEPDSPPKPMAMVGPRPLLWHVMRYYAHFGHTDFVLCLGYGASHITRFFLPAAEVGDAELGTDDGFDRVTTVRVDGVEWSVRLVQTGLDSPIGERLRRVRHHIVGEDMFLANYADVLTDAPLPDVIDRFARSDNAASLLAVAPQDSFHCVVIGADDRIEAITAVSQMPLWENGGYFVLRREVLDLIPPGGDLVFDACTELARQGRLIAYPYRGFWRTADTQKERAALERIYASGKRPWMVWDT